MTAEAHHGQAQVLNGIPEDHNDSTLFNCFYGPQNNRMQLPTLVFQEVADKIIPTVPFAQHGHMEASTTSSPSSRQLATEAVSDAAEKRRVNPHRFFCQYCDRGFTARHNYYRMSAILDTFTFSNLFSPRICQGHLGAHNDERPFGCECGSAFTTKSDLKRHKFKSKKHGHGQDDAVAEYN